METTKKIPFNATRALLQVMNLPASRFTDVCKTSDGFYLGRIPGGLGYDVFIGRPGPVHPGPGLDNTRRVWELLTPAQRKKVRNRANHPTDGTPISLRDFGIGDDE